MRTAHKKPAGGFESYAGIALRGVALHRATEMAGLYQIFATIASSNYFPNFYQKVFPTRAGPVPQR